ncbi:MAG: VOC family protein [Candidatus Bathyarchaeota archaeon]|nr:VOC family protein [Candidatus Bathyarchaeota archaeon]
MSYPIKYTSMYVQVPVKDIVRAKKFYEEIFGFYLEWYISPDVGWCEFKPSGNDARLGLNQGSEGSGATFTIGVEDIVGTREYLEGKGVKVTEITDIPDLVSYFNAWDTGGNRLQRVGDARVTTQ